ncbi:MAG: hypothetical protein K2W96_28200, partial [Gemmataceae bacterium]|nr:hypothetical protein [Gemmataceae bacterium]
SLTGLPVAGLPAGFAPDGLPLGVQLAGGPFEERTVFAAAAWAEAVLGVEMGEAPR